jgi:putative hydrolase
VSAGSQPPDSDPDDSDTDSSPAAGSEAAPFDPFAALHGLDLNDVFRMLQTPGPVNWEIARQCAESIAAADPTSGARRPEAGIDTTHRTELEQLVRVAQTHVTAVSGLAEVSAVPVRVVGRVEWTRATLDGLRPVIESLSSTLTAGQSTSFDPTRFTGNPFAEGDADPEMLAGMLGALAPLLFGVQAGSLVGLLAQHALGQHDLPLPLAGPPQLAFVMSNIESFAADWEIEHRDLFLALALREVVRCAPRSVAWARERLVRLSSEYVSGYEMRPAALEERFADLFGDIPELDDFDPASIDINDPSTFANIPNIDIDPVKLLSGLQTPAQQPIRAELVRFASLLEGYADTLVAELGATLSPATGRVDEALRRHRVEHGRHTEFVEQMLGLAIDRAQYETAAAFCQGVVARAGFEGLNRLWEREAMLPTANEFEAPGLWLARIELDLD